ncbi:MAG: hypothetical protein M9945_14075 [Aquamicrobium sp.]|uniref:hypothetical protein n=1 Tax=Aquamicrobium sp. TaxID=1872579 RepID=UPI00349E8296|nr:hypothetical protein [Aquamicrobium sp.]
MSIRIKKKTRSGEFKQLKACPQAVIDAVESKLLAGETARSIAKSLHEGGHLTEMKEDALTKALTRYRGSELRTKTIERIAGVQKHAGITQLQIRLNALDEMERLVLIQKGRHDKLLAKEAGLPEGIILKDASNEGRLLKEMIMDLGKLQLETGVLQKAHKTVRGQYQGDDGRMHSFEWTEEQEQLFKSIESSDEAFSAEDA